MDMNDLKISVIMSIYKSDVPEYVRIALDSLLNQTRLPDEIVIVADGPVPAELEEVVKSLTPSPSPKGEGNKDGDGDLKPETRDLKPIVTSVCRTGSRNR